MHLPVLKNEVLKYLDPKPNENFIDCTIGLAGHALAILEKNWPKGRVLGIEWDPELYKQLIEKCLRFHLKQRLILVNDSFSNLKEIVEREDFREVSGILFDLGLSSWHLEESKRGFSFLRDEPLIMRYDTKLKILTAEKIINEWPEENLEKILKDYGEERFAKSITRKIIDERKRRPIKTTFQLVEIIKKSVPKRYRGRIHPATRTFQALRIAVNDELKNLENTLPQALEILKAGGRLLIISFHSLEERIVKNFFKEKFKKGLLKILTKKPIRPGLEEIKINPRSRSAKLRVAIKT